MAEISAEISEFEVNVDAETPMTVSVSSESQLSVTDDDPNAAYQYELLACLTRLDNSTYGLQAIKNAFASLQTALQGSDTTATLTAIKTAIAAIAASALSTTDKEWLTNKFNSITIDTTLLAKEATLGTASDTSANNTIFGKIANLLGTFTGWVNGAWSTFITNAATKTDIPTDYAKAGAVAKTLDDVSVDLSTVAKEAQATINKQAIISAMPDVSGLATETNATANKNELTNKIGTASDTSSATTLFGKIAALDSKLQEATDSEIDSILNALT